MPRILIFAFCAVAACTFSRDPIPSEDERCDGFDNDDDGAVDEGCFGERGCFGSDACNGRDDDCDGRVDEDCLADGGVCTPRSEVCDGFDQDCDGRVDEGAPADPERVERENTVDDDCDGRVDEDFQGAECDDPSDGVAGCSNAMSWFDAELACQRTFGGGHLLSVHDAETATLLAAASPDHWIGLSVSLAWTDGSPFDYDARPPGTTAEAGACHVIAIDGSFRQADCEEVRPFLCSAPE